MLKTLCFAFLLIPVLGFAQQPEIKEKITVRKQVVDVRVVRNNGDLVETLTPEDFNLRVNGKKVAVESVDFVRFEEAVETLEELKAAIKEERAEDEGFIDEMGYYLQEYDAEVQGAPWFVFFIQGDLAAVRDGSTARAIIHAKEAVERLPKNAYISVIHFATHMELVCDFTQDHDLVIQALDQARSRDPENVFRGTSFPSLAAYLDETEMADVADVETALHKSADALRPFPGVKNMIYVGWGFGMYHRDKTVMRGRYDDAVKAMNRAQVTVFSLDVTQVDQHSLETGMEEIAFETGGTYQSLFKFPANKFKEVARQVQGYYRITFEIPDDLGERPKFKLKLARGVKGYLYVRNPLNGRRSRY